MVNKFKNIQYVILRIQVIVTLYKFVLKLHFQYFVNHYFFFDVLINNQSLKYLHSVFLLYITVCAKNSQYQFYNAVVYIPLNS